MRIRLRLRRKVYHCRQGGHTEGPYMRFLEPLCKHIAGVKFKMANEEGGGYRWLNQYERTWYVLLLEILCKMFISYFIFHDILFRALK